MTPDQNHLPEYGNWVSDGRIRQTFFLFAVFALLTAGLAALAILARLGAWAYIFAALCLVLAAFLLVAARYFVRAQRLFSYGGGGVQGRIVGLVLDRVEWDGAGRALDIGCGSGALAIRLAKRFPNARIDGIDYWGGSWGYGKKQCEDNAEKEGVADRVAFTRASASALPFPDAAFDLAVSNLVFHEVRDAKDKRDAIKEALRVVKPGGRFVLQDLLLMKPYFGTPEELVALVKSWGVKEVHFEDTSKSDFIPKALKLPFMVGTLGMIYGVK